MVVLSKYTLMLVVKTEPEHLHFSVPEENRLYPEHMLQHAGKHTPALGHRVTFS